MIPIGLEMLGATREMWGLQDRCLSRTTPRKTVSLTCSFRCSFVYISTGKWQLFCRGLNTFSASKQILVISLHLNNENPIAAYIKIYENLFAHAIYNYLS